MRLDFHNDCQETPSMWGKLNSILFFYKEDTYPCSLDMQYFSIYIQIDTVILNWLHLRYNEHTSEPAT